MKVSIILPTYNEAGNIVTLVEEIKRNIPAEWNYEILVVDDDSPDGTYQLVADRFSEDPDVEAILRTTDRGFAKSIRCGIDRSDGDRVIVMDTDFTHDPIEISRLLHISECYDVVSGSRFCPGGRMQDTWHYIASLLFNWLLRVLLRTQVQDNLGGYFIISRDALNKLPKDHIFFGYGEYFFRLLYFLQMQGGHVVEIPAVYNVRTSGESKSRFLKMLFSYFGAAIKLKFAYRKSSRLVDNKYGGEYE